ncbi:MAG: AI-2E family transporter [Patescibacteria group bacterium]|jgi:predicted PurR-regulated permease PerM
MKFTVGGKQPFFYLIAAIIAYLSYMVLKPYFSAIVLAFLATLIFKPIYNFFLRIFSNRQKVAALLSVVFVFLVVFIPVVSIGGLTVKQIIQFKNDFTGNANSITLERVVERVNDVYAYVPGNQEPLTVVKAQESINRGAQAIGSFFLERLPDIGSGAFNSITWIILFLILLYTLFPLHHKLLKFFEEASPLNDRIDAVYATRVVEMSKSMVKGTLLVALVQGGLAGVFLAIAGVPYVLFWTLLMIFLGVIPVIGYGFILIPIAIVLVATGGVWQGIMLILASVLIIGNIDNYLRPKLVSKQAELHPALVILGVLGGLQVFGVLGIIYGPVIMILMVTTYEMYRKYFWVAPEQ